MFAGLVISQPFIRAINSTFALQDLRDGVPVRVVILDAMFLHPFRNGDVIPAYDIAHGVKLLPQLHPEPVAYASVETYLPPWREVVIASDVLMREIRQDDFHLSRIGCELRSP